MAALSLATDLGLGQPLEHELGVCLSALELADRLGCTAEERSDVYYVALLVHVGCTAAAPYFASWVGGDEIHFQSGVQVARPGFRACRGRALPRPSVGGRPAAARARPPGRQAAGRRPEAVRAGGGEPVRGRKAARPAPAPARRGRPRARTGDGALGRKGRAGRRGRGGDLAAAADRPRRPRPRRGRPRRATSRRRSRRSRRRRGRGYDPRVVDAALAEPEALLRAADVPDAWERVLDAEPQPVATISSGGA